MYVCDVGISMPGTSVLLKCSKINQLTAIIQWLASF